MKRIELLHNRHQGQRVVLVANGPSLNRMDLGFLSKETSIGLNKIFLGFKKFGFYPKYYVAVNDLVISQCASTINTLNSIKFISQRNSQLIPESALTYHINTISPPGRFCHDISQGVEEGFTVTYAALQIAFFLGFSEVVIIGMDHRYDYTGRPNEVSHLDGPDPNHFSPDYFGGGQFWDNPDLAHSEEFYQLARREFEKDGRRIIDATLDGACTIFKKVDYRKAFGLSI